MKKKSRFTASRRVILLLGEKLSLSHVVMRFFHLKNIQETLLKFYFGEFPEN